MNLVSNYIPLVRQLVESRLFNLYLLPMFCFVILFFVVRTVFDIVQFDK